MSTDISVPEHIFISYSHRDKKFCSKLTRDLVKAGINVWVDHAGLRPGTPSWNKAIRDAISRSFAVLLLASPDSEQSDVVQGELSLARSYGCPIYPIWVAGKWEESVPLNMIQVQRIDCRGARYSAGLSEVLQELRQIIQRRAVKHFSLKGRDVPQGYLSIMISNTGGREIVAMRPSSYPSLQSLLDDLYVGYLTKRYKPFSYGKDWIISSLAPRVQQLLVPWNWLLENGGPQDENGKGDHQPLFRSQPLWDTFPPETYGLVEGTRWRIIDEFPIGTFGMVTNDPGMGEFLLHGIVYIADEKSGRYFDELIADGVWPRRVVLAEEVNPDSYKFQAIFVTRVLRNGIAFIVDRNLLDHDIYDSIKVYRY